MNQTFLETRMFRLSDCEEIMMLAFFVLIQYRSVTDGQTDGHSSSGYTSALHSSLCNALVKIIIIMIHQMIIIHFNGLISMYWHYQSPSQFTHYTSNYQGIKEIISFVLTRKLNITHWMWKPQFKF